MEENNKEPKDNLKDKDNMDSPNSEERNFIKKYKRLDKNSITISRIKRKLSKNVWLARLMIVSVVLLIFVSLVLMIISVISKTKFSYYYSLAKNFVFAPAENVKSFQGRTNILILGEGGGGHEAPDLTDTIIFLSLLHNGSSIDLISLPRDIWIPALRAKLNSVYYWGNQKQPPSQDLKQDNSEEFWSGPDKVGGGLVLAKSTIEEIIGQPVHYATVIDFEGFREIIGVLGGIEVDVENSFVDDKYPIEGKEDDECDGDPEFKCRYETVEFIRGKQQMDGDTALKFVRSRNAKGDEGTDFARAERQQKVIAGIKQKLIDKKIIFSLDKINQLKKVLKNYVVSDITPEEAAIVARFGYEAKDNIKTHVLSDDLLLNPPKLERFDYLYVLVPKKNYSPYTSKQDWSEIHSWVVCLLKESCDD